MKDKNHYKKLGHKTFCPIPDADAGDIIELVQDGYIWQGEHHKQWFFEQIAAKLGILLAEIDNKGIPP